MARKKLVFGSQTCRGGTSKRIELPVARLPTGHPLSLSLTVVHGVERGPKLFLSAAIHGDELNGIEIIRRVLATLDPKRLRGTVIAAPVVNVFGFFQHDRYLPDRRDLNRSFPGSASGSLAARLAHLFLEEVVSRCEYGIDFHTGSRHRTNLPQIRADLSDPMTRRLAEAFAPPLFYPAGEVPGSLRVAARRRGLHALLFEGGEPHRFNSEAIAVGVDGTLRVLRELDMWDEAPEPVSPTYEAEKTRWVRAPRSGLLVRESGLGDLVREGDVLGRVADPLSGRLRSVKAPVDGLVLGLANDPMVYRGDAVFHLARDLRETGP